MKKEMLHKPNQLIALKAKKKITAIQRKIYNVFLKIAQKEIKFSNSEKIKEEATYYFEVDCNKVHKIAGAKIKDLDYIEEELEKLMGIIATVREKDDKNEWEKFSILPQIKKKNGKYKYMLIGTIVKALQEQNYFTPLNLLMIKSLSSQYSIIFYELAVRYEKYKIPKMSIEKIREITNTEKRYKRIYDFKKRVLDVACKEISEKTDIRLSYTTEKKGRRIAYIDFTIEKKQQELSPERKVKFDSKEKQYSEETLELFNLLPESERVATNKKELAKLLEDHSFRYLKADIEYAKETKPQKFMAFLKSSCQAGHYSSAQIEKEEKKEKKVQQRREEERKRQELQEKIEQKAHEKALVKYDNLSSSELEDYSKNYNSLPKLLKNKVSKKDFTIGAIEKEFEEELKELAQSVF